MASVYTMQFVPKPAHEIITHYIIQVVDCLPDVNPLPIRTATWPFGLITSCGTDQTIS